MIAFDDHSSFWGFISGLAVVTRRHSEPVSLEAVRGGRSSVAKTGTQADSGQLSAD